MKFMFTQFLQTGDNFNEVDALKDRFIYTVPEMQTFVEQSINNYYDLESSNNTLDQFSLSPVNGGNPYRIWLNL